MYVVNSPRPAARFRGEAVRNMCWVLPDFLLYRKTRAKEREGLFVRLSPAALEMLYGPNYLFSSRSLIMRNFPTAVVSFFFLLILCAGCVLGRRSSALEAGLVSFFAGASCRLREVRMRPKSLRRVSGPCPGGSVFSFCRKRYVRVDEALERFGCGGGGGGGGGDDGCAVPA